MTILQNDGDGVYTLTNSFLSIWIDDIQAQKIIAENILIQSAIVDGKTQYWFKGDL